MSDLNFLPFLLVTVNFSGGDSDTSNLYIKHTYLTKASLSHPVKVEIDTVSSVIISMYLLCYREYIMHNRDLVNAHPHQDV